MNIQLALDRLTKEECIDVVNETREQIDWVEIGTGVIKEYGMDFVRDMKARFPEKTLVADMKTCDAGNHEAKQVFEAGADVTTVMAFAADQTIIDMLKVAKKYESRVMVDLLGVSDTKRITEIQSIGVDLVSLHFGKDMQKSGELEDEYFSILKGQEDLEIAVAGGITVDSLPRVMKHNPDTVIVGSAITKQEHKGKVAEQMKEMIRNYERYYSNSSE
ncbi:Fe-S cluster assembly protein HesB [Pontibacillus yanchengensis]|uniref:Fe-S cluster assembly protein HesB n=2 Tax=Pontibacillus yanchengensis TaxID=462910 RepID=A0ACC7VCG6_9BACI|nr:3-hexulose-6-phosphate synthase [Pontibacillus yanchengensis]MYL32019.1 Fe-S cluster assembly protein HesB [Pontibacillus yanchengensis]MYL52596.1 Fe-S cluster assembly protein HesB [Pontibacillus yanchengensis]